MSETPSLIVLDQCADDICQFFQRHGAGIKGARRRDIGHGVFIPKDIGGLLAGRGQLLDRVGLSNREYQLATQLSGGERQRVAIARALMNDPKVILADEPTGNLDEKTGLAVMDLLLELCTEGQTSLILVTHNLSFAERTNRQLILKYGCLENLKESPNDR